jgi:hypothetical protein
MQPCMGFFRLYDYVNNKKMKTYTALEKMGIVEKFRDDNTLYVICKDKSQWKYNPQLQKFEEIFN